MNVLSDAVSLWLTSDAVMVLACEACRQIVIAAPPEYATVVALQHAAECETTKIRMVEMLPSVDKNPGASDTKII